MKKRIYYIFYTVLQISFGIYGFFAAKDIANTELKNLNLSQLPESIANLFSVEALTIGYKFLMIISTIIGFILLILVMKNKKLEKRKLTIGLLIASLFTSLDVIVVLAIVTLIMVLSDKEEILVKKKKKSTNVPEIIDLKTKKKDYISGAILVLVYFGQLLFVPLIYKVTNNSIFSTILYDLIIISVAIWAFVDRYKRDFKYLKDNFLAYVKSAFKYWGIMLLFVLAAGFLQMILGANSESANQEALKTLPLWYLIPTAIIFAPVVEEAVFRGVFRRFIRNDLIFIILSGLAFGLLHTFLSEEGVYSIIVQSLNYMTMGGVLAYAYTKTNNIYTSMMVHAIQNTFGIFMIVIQMFM